MLRGLWVGVSVDCPLDSGAYFLTSRVARDMFAAFRVEV